MKKIIGSILIVFLCQIIYAQKNNLSDLPVTLGNAFSAQYPSGQITKWKSQKGELLVAFQMEKRKYLAFYSPSANWLRTERKIRFSSQLPPKVKTAFYNSKYASWYISEMKQIEIPGKHIYQFHINDGNHLSADRHDAHKVDWLLCFSKSGELEKSQRLLSTNENISCGNQKRGESHYFYKN